MRWGGGPKFRVSGRCWGGGEGYLFIAVGLYIPEPCPRPEPWTSSSPLQTPFVSPFWGVGFRTLGPRDVREVRGTGLDGRSPKKELMTLVRSGPRHVTTAGVVRSGQGPTGRRGVVTRGMALPLVSRQTLPTVVVENLLQKDGSPPLSTTEWTGHLPQTGPNPLHLGSRHRVEGRLGLGSGWGWGVLTCPRAVSP